MPILLDGKKTSDEIREELKKEIKYLAVQGITPGLAVILVGEDPASEVYVRNKKKACQDIGIKSFCYKLPGKTTEEKLLELIQQLNNNDDIHGILVQLPLPAQIRSNRIIKAINPKKDVDGFNVNNIGKMVIGKPTLVSCTPAGIVELLDRYNIEIEGKNCVIVGKSDIVGKPAAILLLNRNATITVCHSKTKHLPEFTRQADILVVAVGRPKLITAEMIKEEAVLIDVGINRLENGKICGDIDFENCKHKASAITPVPGGVGPMTIAMLMKNCVEAAKNLAIKK